MESGREGKGGEREEGESQVREEATVRGQIKGDPKIPNPPEKSLLYV